MVRNGPKFQDRVAFAVPAGAGAYAPERLTFAPRVASGVVPEPLEGVTAFYEVAVATAVIELWLLKMGADPTLDASYFLYKTIAGNGDTLSLAKYPGAQIRVKSGGTAGTLTINATAS